jgi:hypothetical protein
LKPKRVSSGTSAASATRQPCDSTVKSPVGELSQRRRQRQRRGLHQEAQVAVVDAEHRHRAVDHQPHRPEHGAVAAEGDHAADPGHDLGVRDSRHHASQRSSITG